MTAPGKAEPVLPGREEHPTPDTRPAQPDPDPTTVDPEPVTGVLAPAGGLHVTPDDEAVWRATYGVRHLDDWCRAHGWTARTVVSGSLHVEGGTAFALVMVRGADGKPALDRDHRGHPTGPRVLSCSAPLAQPIPAGIGARP